MRVISWKDERENDWAVFKKAWEVRNYQEEAKTNLIVNFSMKKKEMGQ